MAQIGAAPEAGIHRVVTLETPEMPPLLECIGSAEALQTAAPSEAADDASCHKRTVQLCTYNIFEGLNRLEPPRVENFKEWLRAENLDLVPQHLLSCIPAWVAPARWTASNPHFLLVLLFTKVLSLLS